MRLKWVLLLLVLCAPAAWAKTCAVTITGNDRMQFDKSEIKLAGDCTELELTLVHSGSLAATAMGHNWVLAHSADVTPIANAGVSAGLANDYLPPGDKRVIAHTKVIGGGERTSIRIPTRLLQKGGDYSFFCSFPGHWTMMKGKLSFG